MLYFTGRMHPEAKLVGIPWMVVGMVGYVVYRRRACRPRGRGSARALDSRERAHPGPARRDQGFHTGLIRTRSPGGALVDEARRIGADMIYLSTVHAPVSSRGSARPRPCSTSGPAGS